MSFSGRVSAHQRTVTDLRSASNSTDLLPATGELGITLKTTSQRRHKESKEVAGAGSFTTRSPTFSRQRSRGTKTASLKSTQTLSLSLIWMSGSMPTTSTTRMLAQSFWKRCGRWLIGIELGTVSTLQWKKTNLTTTSGDVAQNDGFLCLILVKKIPRYYVPPDPNRTNASN